MSASQESSAASTSSEGVCVDPLESGAALDTGKAGDERPVRPGTPSGNAAQDSDAVGREAHAGYPEARQEASKSPREASDAAYLHDSAVLHSGCEYRGRALDLFCGAGGVSVGLHRAGFEVVGVDLANQPRYPFTFIRADALTITKLLDLSMFDFIWASPPCQHYSDLAHRNGNAHEHPDLINPVRQLLEGIGLSYVIENVEGSPLRDPVTLCGASFGLSTGGLRNGSGYRLRRHRCFESNFPLDVPSCACSLDSRPIIDVSGGGPTHAPRLDGGGGRTYKGTVAEKRAAMGIDWMTGAEIVEAIPPAYAELIGSQVPTRLEAVA